jgi:uncharacterized membrane protein
MPLQKLLRLQLLYYVLGILFNAVSYYLIQSGGQALTPNEPIAGSIGMTLYACFLIPGFLKKISLYRILMGVAVVLLGYGGVLNHINFVQDSPELYHSLTAGIIGVSINIFGLVLNVLALTGRFK